MMNTIIDSSKRVNSENRAPGLSIKHAYAGWENTQLFDDLSLDLSGGLWTCLLGPSGVGKSMLLRMILGLAQDGVDSRGDIICENAGLVSEHVSYMAQQDLLLPWLSIIDNVCLGAKLRREFDKANKNHVVERARYYINNVGLSEQEHAMPATLSGGMRQRVALARTLMEDRPIILMDEPFSALDAISRIRLQDMASAALRDRTVLLVTHDPLEALRLGHNIHVMSGRPARIGHPLTPSSRQPREVDDIEVLTLQGELLHRLSEASS